MSATHNNHAPYQYSGYQPGHHRPSRYNPASTKGPPAEVPPNGNSNSCLNCLAGLASLALFIIGCIAASGSFPGAELGWVTLGLAAGSTALTILSSLCSKAGDSKSKIIGQLVLAAIFITVSALGASGLLSNTQVGWGITGTYLGLIGIGCCCILPLACCAAIADAGSKGHGL